MFAKVWTPEDPRSIPGAVVSGGGGTGGALHAKQPSVPQPPYSDYSMEH
jgi:hypothetical protein